jgi:hypothetical protein
MKQPLFSAVSYFAVRKRGLFSLFNAKLNAKAVLGNHKSLCRNGQ